MARGSCVSSVLIVGAGIAGLSLAAALRQQGIQARLFEAKTGFEPEGTGLHLPGNAVRAARRLGLETVVDRRAYRIAQITYTDEAGRQLTTLDLARARGILKKWPPFVALPRPVFHEALVDLVGVENIRFGSSPVSVSQDDRGVFLELGDGTVEQADLLVGADGVNSAVRSLVFPSRPGARPMGYRCWRWMAPRPAGVTDPKYMIGDGKAVMVMPVDDRLAYIYAMDCAETGEPVASLNDLFAEFGEPATAALAHAVKGRVIAGTLEEVRLEKWSDRRMMVIGDAAHATAPTLAQGAAMAMEDAIVLAEILGSYQGAVTDALRAYEQRRRPRVDYVQRESAKRLRLLRLKGRAARMGRSLLLRVRGTEMLKSGWRPLIRSEP